MRQQVVAFYATALATGALVQVAAVPDQSITLATPFLYVPPKWNKLLYGAAFGSLGDTTRAQLQSPSLREMFFPDISPINATGSADNYFEYFDASRNPIQLQTGEQLGAFVQTSSAAELVTVVCILGDDKVTPSSGQSFPAFATATPTLVAGQWVNGALTFPQPLPAGDYDIIGMRAFGTGLTAARLVFVGESAQSRPGVFAQSTGLTMGQPMFRQGNNGTYGRFNNVTPPTVDHLGAVGAITSSFVFDLVKVA
jgi:hypothetical protein